jgi:hypothetical protein
VTELSAANRGKSANDCNTFEWSMTINNDRSTFVLNIKENSTISGENKGSIVVRSSERNFG